MDPKTQKIKRKGKEEKMKTQNEKIP